MKVKYIIITIIIATVLLSIQSCSTKPQNNTPLITVTIEPLRFFAESIVGDKYTVVSMVPQGSSPETYDPTPQQLIDLSKSELYLKIGHIGFELTWMDKILNNIPNLNVVDTSNGIDLIRATGHRHGDHYHEGGVEPHVWNSTINAKIIAQNILHAVIKLDNTNKTYYEQNYLALVKEIKKTDLQIKEALANPNSNKGFLIYHPALSYFARDYGLLQVSIEEDGKEPTPAYLKQLIKTCRERDIHIIFIQPEFDQKNAEIIAKETQSKVIPINPLAYNWKDEMINTAQTLGGLTY